MNNFESYKPATPAIIAQTAPERTYAAYGSAAGDMLPPQTSTPEWRLPEATHVTAIDPRHLMTFGNPAVDSQIIQ